MESMISSMNILATKIWLSQNLWLTLKIGRTFLLFRCNFSIKSIVQVNLNLVEGKASLSPLYFLLSLSEETRNNCPFHPNQFIHSIFWYVTQINSPNIYGSAASFYATILSMAYASVGVSSWTLVAVFARNMRITAQRHAIWKRTVV